MATTDMTTDVLTEHQVAMLEELGFSKDEATKLAEARTTTLVKGGKGGPRRYEQKVDHHYVKRLLANGASREQVLAILL